MAVTGRLTLPTLRIFHRTSYLYREPVGLGPHRLMLRPRESRELRLLSSGIEVTPPAALTWAHDVSGNAVATAAFAAPTDRLVIASGVELELGAEPWPVFDIAAAALTWPSPTRRRIRLDSNSVDPCRSEGVSVEAWEDDREQSGFENPYWE